MKPQTMKRTHIFFLLIAAAMPALTAQDPADSLCTSVGFVASVESGQLGQTRKLYIHLPEGFDAGRTYPLVVLLDGEATFRAFASVTALMAWQKIIPGCIVVGIPNIHREMDYAPVIEGIPGSGNAYKMMSFYREELFPFLEGRYHIGRKILYGHSWVGFFATYVMLTEPALFDGYISTSPMFRFFDQVLEPSGLFSRLEGQPLRFYASLGGEETMSRQLERFMVMLGNEAPASLEWKFVVQEGKNHDTNALTGYMEGLGFVLGGSE
jgi:predicted alpha/beta superfamily hydrolase